MFARYKEVVRLTRLVDPKDSGHKNVTIRSLTPVDPDDPGSDPDLPEFDLDLDQTLQSTIDLIPTYMQYLKETTDYEGEEVEFICKILKTPRPRDRKRIADKLLEHIGMYNHVYKAVATIIKLTFKPSFKQLKVAVP